MSLMKALMDTVYYSKNEAEERYDCEVRFDNEDIIISYEDDFGKVLYKGKDIGHGHYKLRCPERNGEATLHQIPKSKILEGFWIEEGEKGFWRIVLL